MLISLFCSLQCHEHRSLHENRQLARARMQERLDFHYNGENSAAEQLKKKAILDRKKREKKSIEKLKKLQDFKEREGLS